MHKTEQNRAYRKGLMDRGLCVECLQTKEVDRLAKVRCLKCTRKGYGSYRKYRQKLIDNGLCKSCRKPLEGDRVGKTQCMECVKKYSKMNRDNRMRDGICATCPNKKEEGREGKSLCLNCTKRCVEINKRSLLSRVDKNVCTRCGKDEIINLNKLDNSTAIIKHRVCYKCYLQRIAVRYLGSRRKWEELDTLFKAQSENCALSGIPLVIGENAHVDHIVPCLGKNKLTTIGNLQWVHRDINFMKRELSVDRLIELCKLIAQKYV